jgi:hypothetical protein
VSDTRKKSAYAKKQGRARRASGDKFDGPRMRYAPTSPLCESYRANPEHRLAQYWERGERLERERVEREREWRP